MMAFVFDVMHASIFSRSAKKYPSSGFVCRGWILAPGSGDKGMIVRIERLRNDDLVAVVQNTVACDLERFAPARGDEHIPRVQRHADARIIAADRVDQRRDAGEGA